MAENIIELQRVSKIFKQGSVEIPIFKDIDLAIPEGEFISLMGPSGSGKSTLLHLLLGIDRPTSGKVIVTGNDLSQFSDAKLAEWRTRKIGMIFQFYNLIPVLTGYENVALPLGLIKMSRKDRDKRVKTALNIVGLEDRMNHYPRQLSGGQQQRVAIARALVMDPKLLLADEPTGAVDRESAEEILKLFAQLNREFNKTIVLVTHDPNAAAKARVTRRIDKGQLI